MADEGISVGLFRPVTLFPFPEKQIKDELTKKHVKAGLVVEMSTAQMMEDVEKAVLGKKPLHFFGRTGGIVPTPDEVKDKIRRIIGGRKTSGRKKA